MAAPGTVLHADWKIVTRTGETSAVEYFKDSLMRTDSPPIYTVLDFDHRRQVNWRNDLRQYVVVEWPPEYQRDSSSGPVITIEQNTTDTGERQQFFGRTARHLVTHTTRSDSPDARCSRISLILGSSTPISALRAFRHMLLPGPEGALTW
jgi:hypothetical protein